MYFKNVLNQLLESNITTKPLNYNSNLYKYTNIYHLIMEKLMVRHCKTLNVIDLFLDTYVPWVTLKGNFFIRFECFI